jgi:hypothetical protein
VSNSLTKFVVGSTTEKLSLDEKVSLASWAEPFELYLKNRRWQIMFNFLFSS